MRRFPRIEVDGDEAVVGRYESGGVAYCEGVQSQVRLHESCILLCVRIEMKKAADCSVADLVESAVGIHHKRSPSEFPFLFRAESVGSVNRFAGWQGICDCLSVL